VQKGQTRSGEGVYEALSSQEVIKEKTARAKEEIGPTGLEGIASKLVTLRETGKGRERNGVVGVTGTTVDEKMLFH